MQVIDNAQVRKFHMPGFTQQTLTGPRIRDEKS